MNKKKRQRWIRLVGRLRDRTVTTISKEDMDLYLSGIDKDVRPKREEVYFKNYRLLEKR